MTDRVTELLAAYAVEVAPVVGSGGERDVKRCLLDALGVALGAVRHPAARAARRYGYAQPAEDGPRIWSTPVRATPEAATLCNGVLLRCYDYNDLYFGGLQWGHPGDVVSGLLTVADWRHAPGSELLDALAVAYDIVLELCDTASLAARGWDYVNLIAVGGTCGLGRLLGLTPRQVEHALAIAVIPHLATNQVESNDLDESGNLTMWKRFNGADAMRQAVYACLLAASGVEGPLRPFEGVMGSLRMLGIGEEGVAEALRGRLGARAPLHRAADAEFKSWPVGSRAQSAIAAAFEVGDALAHPWEIDRVVVHADAASVAHLVRDDAFAPRSRETADHSLPYIVAAALLDGRIDPSSFAPARYEDPALRAFLAERVTVESDPALSQGAAAGFPVRLEVLTTSGDRIERSVGAAPGHRSNPFTDEQLAAKVHRDGDLVVGREAAAALVDAVWSLEAVEDVRSVIDLLVA